MAKRKGRAPCGVADITWSQAAAAAASEVRCLARADAAGSSDVLFTRESRRHQREERSSACDFRHTCHNKGRRSFSVRSLRERKEGQDWKKKKKKKRGKCWQDESGPADAKRNCAQTPQAKDNNNPSNVLARAVRSCHADSFWPRALQGPFPLSLSPLTVVSARSVAQSTNSTHTHTNVISSWPPSKRTVPKRKQPDAIVQ